MAKSRHHEYLEGIPADWDIVPVEALGEVCAGGTPGRRVPHFWNGDIPWLTPGETTTAPDKWLTGTREFITRAGIQHSGARLLPRGSILVTTRATLGNVVLASAATATNQGFKNIVPRYGVNPEFYYYLFRFIAPELMRLSSGTTFPEICGRDFKRIRVPRPQSAEQSVIAAVLGAIDGAIQKTEAVIAKLKRMKAGLLHDLHTRGIDDNGELRDAQAHPEQFRQTPLGRLPTGWDCVHLESLSDLITSGSRGWAQHYADSGALFLRIGNLTREHVNLDLTVVAYVKPPRRSEGARTAVEEGDLLISITADLGIIGVVPGGLGEGYVNQHIALVRLRRGEADPRWVGNWLAGPVAQKAFYRLNDAGAKAGLNLPTVGGLVVPKPQPEEQGRIANVIKAQDARIVAEQHFLAKLRLASISTVLG